MVADVRVRSTLFSGGGGLDKIMKSIKNAERGDD